jgi:hypothetical protein
MIALILFGGLALYFAVAVVVTKSLVHWAKSKVTKWLVGFTSALVFFLIPTWDEIAGRIYLYKACVTEGGIRVHKTIELAPEYWHKDGKPKFVTSSQNKPTVIMEGRYKFVSEGYKPYSEPLNLKRYQLKLVETESGEDLGSYTRIAFDGGWLLSRLPAHYSAVICPSNRPFDFELIEAVFSKK